MENLKEVVEIFDLITKTSGKNDKIKIVKKNKDNELFIECLKFLLDSDIVTGLRGYSSTPALSLEQLEDDIVDERLQIIKEYWRVKCIVIYFNMRNPFFPNKIPQKMFQHI